MSRSLRITKPTLPGRAGQTGPTPTADRFEIDHAALYARLAGADGRAATLPIASGRVVRLGQVDSGRHAAYAAVPPLNRSLSTS